MYEVLQQKSPLYLKTDVSVIGLGGELLQAKDRMQFPHIEAPDNTKLCPMIFPSKCLTSTESHYSNFEREVLTILHRIQIKNFHHYCITHEVSMITDQKCKLLVAIFKKDVAILSKRLQMILLQIHQYFKRIPYKPGLQLFIADWLSRHNHNKGKDEEILAANLNINSTETCTDIQECMIEDEKQIHTTR